MNKDYVEYIRALALGVAVLGAMILVGQALIDIDRLNIQIKAFEEACQRECEKRGFTYGNLSYEGSVFLPLCNWFCECRNDREYSWQEHEVRFEICDYLPGRYPP